MVQPASKRLVTEASHKPLMDSAMGGDVAGLVPAVAGKVAKGDLLIHLKDYSTVKGDNATDDTAAIQAVIDAAPNGSTVIAERGKTYLTTGVTITGKTDFQLDGNRSTFRLPSTGSALAAVKMSGTLSNVSIRHLRVKGSGVLADAHAGIAASGANLTNVRVEHCRIADVTLGISFSADPTGSIVGLTMSNNYVTNVVGTAAGFGYGLHVSILGTQAAGVIIANNVVSSAQRHGIYCAKGRGITVTGNVVLNHRDANVTGTIMPAINVSRCGDVSVVGNTVQKYAGGALYLGGPGTDGSIAGPYTVAANTFSEPQDGASSIVVGQLDPATDGIPAGVLITGNTITSSTARNLITVYNGKNVDITGNLLQVRGAGAMTAITFSGSGVTGNDYMDAISVEHNLFDLDAANTASKAAMRFGPGHEVDTTNYWFTGNRLIAGAVMFALSASCTNPNISMMQQAQSGFSYTGGATSLALDMAGPTTTTAPAAGAGGALPATPAGYFTVKINGTARKVAYY